MKRLMMFLALTVCSLVTQCSAPQKSASARIFIDNCSSDSSKTFIRALLCNNPLQKTELWRGAYRENSAYITRRPIFLNRKDRQVYYVMNVENPDNTSAQLLSTAIKEAWDQASYDYKGQKTWWTHYSDGSTTLTSAPVSQNKAQEPVPQNQVVKSKVCRKLFD